MAFGHKFSIMELLEQGPALTRQMLRIYGLEEFLASIRVLGLTVEEIWADKERLKEAIPKEGKKAVEEDGADAIVLSCGFMSGMAKELEDELAVPVIDPWGAAIKFAEMLLSLGLSHSKKAHMTRHPKRTEI